MGAARPLGPAAGCVAGEDSYSFWRLVVLPAAGFVASVINWGRWPDELELGI